MHEKDIEVSFFIEPDEKQIAAVKECGGDMVEFHTGTYANLREKHLIATELYRLNKAINKANDWGLTVAAGHGLNYNNTQAICEIQGINELSIGHSIISRAAFVGIDRAVREMLDIIHKHSS
jgi:pyridoxine 5-phosphate synthase